MSKKKTIAGRVRVDGGGCCKCGEALQRFRHAEGWRPTPGRGWHEVWDQCSACRRVYVYSEHFRAAGEISAPSATDAADLFWGS